MTPQEQAEELVNKFMTIDSDSEMFDGFKMKQFYAQRCALIAVDEVLNDDWFIPNREDLLARKEYWEEVKKEINNL